MRTIARRGAFLLPGIAWAAMSFIFFIAWSSNGTSRDRYLISDMATAYNLALDLARDATAVLDWHLPPANYIFPDQIFLAPFASAGWRIVEIVPFYGSLSLLVLTAGGYALGRQYLPPVAAAVAAAVLASVAGNMMITGYYPNYLIAAPAFHASLAILWPAVLAASSLALSHRLSGRRAWPAILGLCALAGLLAFSDRLSAVINTTPVLVGLAIVALTRRESRLACLSIGLPLLISSSGGVILDSLWRPDNPGAAVAPAIGEFFANSAEMWRLSTSLREGIPWLFYAVLATPLIAAVALGVEIFLRRDLPGREGWLLLLASVLAYYLVIQLVHGATTLEPVLHYRLPDVVIACIFLPIVFLRCASHLGSVILGPAAALVLCVYAAVDAAQSGSSRDYGRASIEPLVKCLDQLATKYHLAYGAGEYWDAVPVRPLSLAGLVAVSVQPNLTPRAWNQTARIDARRPFDFIILDKSMEAAALQSLPAPIVIERCGDREILIPAPVTARPGSG